MCQAGTAHRHCPAARPLPILSIEDIPWLGEPWKSRGKGLLGIAMLMPEVLNMVFL